VFKIPPVFERQTASNISIEHGVEVKGLETCKLKLPQASSASRGARLEMQQQEQPFGPVKIETTPLLSPTMESRLMREPWNYPGQSARVVSCLAPPSAVLAVPNSVGGGSTRPSASTAATTYTTPQLHQQQQQQLLIQQQQQQSPSSSWEENFQDLSGWCMSGAHARCDFTSGECATGCKLTGTKNEVNDIFIAGATSCLMPPTGQNMNSDENAIMGARQPQTGSVVPATIVMASQLDHAYPMAGHRQQQQQLPQQTFFTNDSAKTHMTGDDLLKNNGNLWASIPERGKTVAVLNDNNNIVWPEAKETKIDSSSLPLYTDSSPLVADSQTKAAPLLRQDSGDVFHALGTGATNSFDDLLSYLCEDDIPSPPDSVSTDSSRITDPSSIPRLPSNPSAHMIVSPKTYEPIPLSPSLINTNYVMPRLDSTGSMPEDSIKLSPQSSPSEVMTPVRSSYQLRTIVKVEDPETPPPSSRRQTRAKRSRVNSNASRVSSNSSRGRGRKRVLEDSESDDIDDDDDSYREVREKNNEASRKSRMNKKAKEMEMAKKAVVLEKDNRILKMKVEELEKLVSSMRNALLRSALKREIKPRIY
ncbi:hypothetical protein QAD02_012241, partial [Eretmocerus hayati]